METPVSQPAPPQQQPYLCSRILVVVLAVVGVAVAIGGMGECIARDRAVPHNLLGALLAVGGILLVALALVCSLLVELARRRR